jgi:hypothetical protein
VVKPYRLKEQAVNVRAVGTESSLFFGGEAAAEALEH